METILNLAISLLAFSGYLLANYIRDTKKSETPLVCPLEGSCETVVHSEYAKIMDIPVELIGIFYYAAITLTYFLFAFFPDIMPTFASYVTLGISTVAFLFSLYLTSVQSFILKHWCTWCLMSAGWCTIIFIIATYLDRDLIIEFLKI